MAIINTFDDPNKKKTNPDGSPKEETPAGPVSVSGQAATINSSNTAPNPVAAKGSNSGRFTNISNYLKANQGSNLAGKVAGNIENQSNQVRDALNQSKNQFSEQAQAGRVQGNQNLVNEAIQDPNSFAANQEKLQQFERLRDAQYKGPQELQGVQKLGSDVENLQSLTKQTGTEGGRFNLLRTMFNKPTYSGGQQKLDNLLMQTNQDQLNKLRGSNVITSRINQDLNNSSKLAADQGNQLAAEAQNIQYSTRKALSDEETARQNDLNFRLNDIASKRGDAQKSFTDLLKEGKMTSADLAKFGVDPNQGLYGLTNDQLLNYMSTGKEANKYNIASADDYSRFDALSKLAGKDNTYLAGQYKDQAGTLDDPYGFNAKGLADVLGTQRTIAETDKADLVKPYDDTIASLQARLNGPGSDKMKENWANQLNNYVQERAAKISEFENARGYNRRIVST